jgi:hypothetical protein
MVIQKLNKVILDSKTVIIRENMAIFIKNEIDNKYIKIVNGFLYMLYKVNGKHLLNRKIFIRISDNIFETCLEADFVNKFDITFENFHIINNCLYLVENTSDKLKINKLIRKEKIKEILEV